MTRRQTSTEPPVNTVGQDTVSVQAVRRQRLDGSVSGWRFLHRRLGTLGLVCVGVLTVVVLTTIFASTLVR